MVVAFRLYKFRTMVGDAEARKAEYAHLNELAWPDFKIRDDPRITRIGRILRRLSLDELPQLLNVLKGEMSLVGPRPTSFTPEAYRLWHTARLEVAPGITGLSQISGRSKLDFDQRVKLDLAYIERASLWFGSLHSAAHGCADICGPRRLLARAARPAFNMIHLAAAGLPTRA